ncbi:beta-amyrin 16-alpha-hydroxylase CYP87D16-like [Syzygium oleosum]|uniref:beta-amyrin 16-alpha-hydroxylase CYP87D16-like n=1 Tax=Syzygium oleosum TaxID=219896 RepID=UPI0011D1BED9|nr:beta-amyrin 16-alpha-hydroxylase CYP87D16-like [Syzygium oleosum]
MDAFSKLLALDVEARVNALGVDHKYGRGITLSHFGTESLKQSLLTQTEEIMIFKLNTKFMFGYNFAKSLEKIGEKLIKCKLSIYSFPLSIPGTEYHNFLKAQKKMKDLFRNMIKETHNSTGASDGPGDFLDHAIADMQTEQFLTDFHGVSTGITLIVNFISAHPSVLDELQAEHRAILERRESTRHTLNWDEYRSMKFTHEVNIR